MVTSNASPLPPEKKHLQCLFGLFSKGTGHRDVPGRGHIPTRRRPRDRKAARGRVGASVLFFFVFLCRSCLLIALCAAGRVDSPFWGGQSLSV